MTIDLTRHTPKEIAILKRLLDANGRTVSQEKLAIACDAKSLRSIRAHVAKLKRAGYPIYTAWMRGYFMETSK